MSRRATLIRGAVVAALVLLSSARAAAGDAERRAEQTFAQATAAFERRDFPAAAAAYELAATYAPHPVALLNAGEAWEKAGELAKAARAYDRVLASSALEARYLAAARRRLAIVEPKIATLDVPDQRRVTVSVDGAESATLPVRLRLLPGRHTISFIDQVSGATRTEDLTLAAGELRHVEAPPSRPVVAAVKGPDVASPAARPQSADAPPRNYVPAYLALGATGVAGVAATFFGVRTVEAQDAFDRDPTRDNADRFYSAKMATNVGIGVGAACAAAAILLVLFAPPHAAPPARVGSALD